MPSYPIYVESAMKFNRFYIYNLIFCFLLYFDQSTSKKRIDSSYLSYSYLSPYFWLNCHNLSSDPFLLPNLLQQAEYCNIPLGNRFLLQFILLKTARSIFLMQVVYHCLQCWINLTLKVMFKVVSNKVLN